MKKLIIALGVMNFILLLVVIGLAASFWTSMYIIGGLLFLRFFVTPLVALYLLFGKYKGLRQSFERLFNFFALIQQQLRRVDQMQITNLQIVRLKQKINSLRKVLNMNKESKNAAS